MKSVDEKLLALQEYFNSAFVECFDLRCTIPNSKKYNDTLDEIQKLCVQIQEKFSELYM